ncbi:MAG: hypothetical protein ACW99F_19980 [Candidatus Hodarchaeales archaeon]|jgi:hypothetical protein
MLYSHVKQLNLHKIAIILILLSFWGVTTPSANAAVTADYGDVVDVIYWLYRDEAHTNPIGVPPNEQLNIPLPFIYLKSTPEEPVPQHVLDFFPGNVTELQNGYIQPFLNALIGIEENGEKDFMILEENTPYNDGDLYYHVWLLQIRFDAFVGETSETTTTTKRNSGELDTLTIIGGGLGIVTVSILFWGFSNQRRRQKVLEQDSSSTVRREQSIKHKKTQLRELRELAESRTSDTDVKESSKTDVKFRRRR